MDFSTILREDLIGRSDDFQLWNQVLKIDRSLDQILNLDSSIDSSKDQDDFYYDLSADALNTSYHDFWQIFTQLDKKSTFVDLGSGVSRGAFVALNFDGLKYIGIELMDERISSTIESLRKLGQKSSDILKLDLSSSRLPSANYYFIYFPLGKTLSFILMQLIIMAKNNNFEIIVIESHGDLIDKMNALSFSFKLRDSSLTTSLPRHNNKIHFFKTDLNPIKYIDLEYDIANFRVRKETFPLALLFWQQEKKNYLNFSGWVLRMDELDIVKRGSDLHLLLMDPEREILIENFTSITCFNSDSAHPLLDNLYFYKKMKMQFSLGSITKIFLKENEISIECLSGDIIPLQKFLSLLPHSHLEIFE